MATANLPAVRPLNEIETMAKSVAASNLFGMNQAQATTLMLLAQSEGIDPIRAVMRYHVIQGKPAMKADAMLADFQAAGGTVEWTERTNTAWEGVFRHPTHAPKGYPVRFTIEDAKRAELTKNPMWNKYPSNMLRARTISNGIRLVMPGIVAGIYTPEEVEDMAPIRATARVVEAPPQSAPASSEYPRTPWWEWAEKFAADRNAEWADELDAEGVTLETAKAADAIEITNIYRLSNFITDEALKDDAIERSAIVRDDNPKKRDTKKTLATAADLFRQHPEWVEPTAKDHVQLKRLEYRARLGLVVPPANVEEAMAEALTH